MTTFYINESDLWPGATRQDVDRLINLLDVVVGWNVVYGTDEQTDVTLDEREAFEEDFRQCRTIVMEEAK